MYSVAEAAGGADAAAENSGGLLGPLIEALDITLQTLQTGLETLHVPYSYGFSIILLTLLVKVVTFPLTKAQVESTLAVQTLKPRIDLIKVRPTHVELRGGSAMHPSYAIHVRKLGACCQQAPPA